jgi:hypothetical protein
MTHSFARRAALFITLAIIAVASVPAQAGAPTTDTTPLPINNGCMTTREIVRFYTDLKQADSVSVRKTYYANTYAVAVKKNGKTGKYEFNSCTRTSFKVS